MKIVEALKNNILKDVRLRYDTRTMLWSDLDNAWIVYEQIPYSRSAKEVIMTEDEDEAVAHLLNEADP